MPGCVVVTHKAAARCLPDPASSDYKFGDGRVYRGGLDEGGKPCGSGCMFSQGEQTRGHNWDAEGHQLDGKPFTNHGRSGFLKFYAMSGPHLNTYELLYTE